MINNSMLEQAKSFLSEFGIKAAVNLDLASEGRIATNYIVRNSDDKSYILRIYDLDSGWVNGRKRIEVEFEARVLEFAQGRSPVATPCLIRPEERSDRPFIERGGKIAMLYRMLEGNSLQQSQLTKNAARKAGECMRAMIDALDDFEPDPDTPDGGIPFIAEIAEGVRTRCPDLYEDERLSDMLQYVTNFPMTKDLDDSPRGVVHGDFFFENTLWDADNNLVGVIDYGDSFYGEKLHDIAIGAMEFSFGENEKMIDGAFDAFLSPFSSWFGETGTDKELFRAVLLANCVRFSSYLIAIGLDDSAPLQSLTAAKYNPYIDRFQHFSQPDSLSGVSGHFR